MTYFFVPFVFFADHAISAHYSALSMSFCTRSMCCLT